MKYLLIFLISVCWPAIPVFAENLRLQPASIAEPWRWNELTSLQSYQIKSGAEGKEGELWFVHSNGLVKYDGYEIERYQAEGFQLEGAIDLFISSTGVIIIPTWNGLYIFEDNTFTAHSQLRYNLGFRNAVAEDNKGRLFTVSAYTGELFQIDGNRLKKIDIQLEHPTSLLFDHQSNLWVVESGKPQVSVFKLDGQGDSLEVELIQRISCNPENSYITRLLKDSKNRVWVMDPDEQDMCYYYEDYKQHPGFSGLRQSSLWGEALNVVETPAGNILFSVNRLLGRFDGDKLTVFDIQDYPIPSSPPYLRILDSGKVLLGGYNLNPYLIDLSPSRWLTYPGLNFQCEDVQGNHWFLSHDRKVVVEGSGVWETFDANSGLIDTPNRIIAGTDGSIWVSGAHQGNAAVAWLDGDTWNFQTFPHASSTFSHLAALQIGEGQFAFGCGTPVGELKNMIGGGAIFEKQGNSYKGAHFPPPAFIPRTATMAHREGDGLYMGSGYIARGFSNTERLAANLEIMNNQWIDHMIVDSNNHLWVACLGIGVYQFDGTEWKLHGLDTGLTNPNVICLLDDSIRGGILALTNTGLVYFDGFKWRPWEFQSDIAFRRENHTLFQSKEGAFWINYSSRGWFLEGDSISDQSNNFRTIRYVPDSQAPETFASLSKNRFPEGSQISVSLDAVDPWDETSREDLMFSWKLNEGEWSIFSSGFQTVLSNLDSGFYEMQIRSRDQEGNIDNSPQILAFTVIPPLWKNPLFMVVVLLLLALIAFLTYSLFRVRVQAAVAMETFKLDFFTNISHELRNPLAVILAPIENLLKEEPDGDKRNNLRIVLRNARKMQGMVDQLLHFRKLQAGKWEIQPAPGEIIGFVRDEVYNIEPLWEKKGQHLELTVHPTSCVCVFDPNVIQTIIDNLLSNAVKYSEPETNIRFDVTVRPVDNIHQISLVVEDEGMSIPSHELDNILSPFYRVNGKGDNTGTGIGLALVDHLVKLCGGSIDVQSPVTSDGKGSRFSVLLPLDGVEEEGFTENKQLENQNASSSHTTVLVVEDNADFRQLLVQEISSSYTVIEAENGAEGLAHSIKLNPDIIISDVMMPEMDGLELCERLKSDSETSHIPIILLTAKSAHEHRIKGLRVGADAYISKPLKFDHLLVRIQNLLKSRQELRQQFTRRILVQPSEVTVTPTDERILDKAIRAVDENMIEEDFDVQQFSRVMGMSKSSLVRKLKAITGLTPLHFIQSMRMKRAAVLLKEGVSVSEAASQVGMYNMSYFSKIFRKEFGVVPSQYKESQEG